MGRRRRPVGRKRLGVHPQRSLPATARLALDCPPGVRSARRVGARGQAHRRFCRQSEVGPYAANFNGCRWRSVPVPGRADLGAVSAVSRNDVFAASGTFGSTPLVEARDHRHDLRRIERCPVDRRRHPRSTATKRPASCSTETAPEWQSATPAAASSGTDALILSLASGARGAVWALGLNSSSGASQIWHYRNGSGSAPFRLPWPVTQLAAVPRSTVTWQSAPRRSTAATSA